MEGRGHCSGEGEREAITAAVEMRGEHRGRKKENNAASERARGGRAKRGNQPNVNSRERAAKDGRAGAGGSHSLSFGGTGQGPDRGQGGEGLCPVAKEESPAHFLTLIISGKRRFFLRKEALFGEGSVWSDMKTCARVEMVDFLTIFCKIRKCSLTAIYVKKPCFLRHSTPLAVSSLLSSSRRQ